MMKITYAVTHYVCFKGISLRYYFRRFNFNTETKHVAKHIHSIPTYLGYHHEDHSYHSGHQGRNILVFFFLIII